MKDPYPEVLNLEIDRDGVRRYLRVKWMIAWTLPLAFFGGMFGLAGIDAVSNGAGESRNLFLIFLQLIAMGAGGGALLGLVCYLLFSHRLAARLASTLTVSVEGAFLRVRQRAFVLSDRKLHFRAIVDFAMTQDDLMRSIGIEALEMTTTGGGKECKVVIPGVKECLKTRDLLADIDRLRENA